MNLGLATTAGRKRRRKYKPGTGTNKPNTSATPAIRCHEGIATGGLCQRSRQYSNIEKPTENRRVKAIHVVLNPKKKQGRHFKAQSRINFQPIGIALSFSKPLLQACASPMKAFYQIRMPSFLQYASFAAFPHGKVVTLVARYCRRFKAPRRMSPVGRSQALQQRSKFSSRAADHHAKNLPAHKSDAHRFEHRRWSPRP